MDRGDKLERVQVKYCESRDGVIELRCRSHSLTNGRVRQTKKYTAATIEWLAVYDLVTDRCYYVPATKLGAGRATMHLRLTPALNGMQRGINWARDYVDF